MLNIHNTVHFQRMFVSLLFIDQKEEYDILPILTNDVWIVLYPNNGILSSLEKM